MLKFMQIGAKNAKHLARKDKIDTLNSKNEIENSNQVVEEICPQKTGSKLDQLRICGLCRGIGIRKVYYNHMVLDQNCEECVGEGVQEIKSVSSENRREKMMHGKYAQMISIATVLAVVAFVATLLVSSGGQNENSMRNTNVDQPPKVVRHRNHIPPPIETIQVKPPAIVPGMDVVKKNATDMFDMVFDIKHKSDEVAFYNEKGERMEFFVDMDKSTAEKVFLDQNFLGRKIIYMDVAFTSSNSSIALIPATMEDGTNTTNAFAVRLSNQERIQLNVQHSCGSSLIQPFAQKTASVAIMIDNLPIAHANYPGQYIKIIQSPPPSFFNNQSIDILQLAQFEPSTIYMNNIDQFWGATISDVCPEMLQAKKPCGWPFYNKFKLELHQLNITSIKVYQPATSTQNTCIEN